MTLRIKIFTVPGQVLHASTRKLVLQGADGVAFIADSQISETEHNAASFFDLRQNLKDLSLSLKEMPLVIQFNKRDLDRVRSDDELGALARRGREPVFRASAVNGHGRARDVLRSAAPDLDEARRRAPAREDARHRVGRSPADGRAPARDRDRRRRRSSRRASAASSIAPRRCPRDAPKRPNVRVEDLVLDGRIHLEDLVDRDALDELCKSFVVALRHPRPHLLERRRAARGRRAASRSSAPT